MSIFSVKKRIRSGLAGVSIIEALLALAVFGTLAAGMMSMVWGPLVTAGGAVERVRAAMLAEEGLDAARSIRNAAWTDLVDGDHGLDRSGGYWMFLGANDTTPDGIYTRTVNVAPVGRDVSFDIVETGGTVDPRTKKVTSTVTWVSPFGGPHSLDLTIYLTNWNVYDYTHTNELDFAGGTLAEIVIVGSGDTAHLELDTGTAAGTFLSPILDTNGIDSSFETAFWHATLPAGTSVSVATRSGDTDTPDGTWSGWSAELTDSDGSATVSPSARYFQYRVTLSTTDLDQTPFFEDITITYTQ